MSIGCTKDVVLLFFTYAWNKTSYKYPALSKPQFTCHSNELVWGLCFVCLKCGLLAEEVFGLHFCSLFHSSSLCQHVDLWVMLHSGSGDWLDKLTQLRMTKKKKSILVFFFLSDCYLAPSTIWLHKYYHCCSKVVLQLSAVPSGHGRLNWPCKCSLGRWLCWGLQCTYRYLGWWWMDRFRYFASQQFAKLKGRTDFAPFHHMTGSRWYQTENKINCKLKTMWRTVWLLQRPSPLMQHFWISEQRY